MKNAEQLQYLAMEYREAFRHEIMRRVAPHEVEESEQALLELVLMMPSLLHPLRRLWREPSVPSHVKKLSGCLLSYLYYPQELIDDKESGLFVYIDDAYLTAAVTLQAVEYLDHHHPIKQGLDGEWILRIRRLREAARRVIPEEAQQIDQMIQAVLGGDDRAFHQPLGANSGH